MCAIAGYFDFRGSQDLEGNILKMLSSMRHRGPDNTQTEIFSVNNGNGMIALGHNRLSIIDLSRNADQPMSNEDGTVWIVYNGEIYNFQELRDNLQKNGHKFKSRSDTEVILHLYEDFGSDSLRLLKGMFAFCIYDRKKNRFFLARDRFGKKPLYYYYDSEKFIFASEIKAIVGLEEIDREIEPIALESYFSLSYIPGPYTIYKNIFKLSPGHFMILEKNGLSINRYWDLEFKRQKLPEKEYLERFSLLLEKAVKYRLISDVPLGVFLSGGIDSSILVAAMSKFIPQQIKTYSIGFQEPEHNELDYANLIASHFNTSHHTITLRDCQPQLLEKIVWHLDEPLADGATVPTYLLAKLAKETVTVVLTGEGSDETLGGYPYYYYEKLISYYSFLPQYLKKIMLPAILPAMDAIFNSDIFKKIARYGRGEVKEGILRWRILFDEQELEALFKQEIKKSLQIGKTKESFKEIFNNCQAENIIAKALYIDSRIYLPDDLLMKIDKLTMANSLEARCPYLDHDLIEFVAMLPVRMKVRGRVGKYILKKCFKGEIPEMIIKRPKHGFTVPIDKWLNGSLKEVACEAFRKGGILDRTDFFNIEFIENLWEKMLTANPDARLTRQLWALLNFAVWWRQNEGICSRKMGPEL